MRSIRRAAVPFSAIGLAVAVCLVVAPGATASHHSYGILKTVCSSPSDGMMQVRVKHHLRVQAHKRNNLRSIRVQARLLPADPGAGFSWSYAWGTTVTSKKVPANGDGAVNWFLWSNTPPQLFDNYNLEVKATWDRKLTNDWDIYYTYPFNEGFCQGGNFREAPLTATGTSFLGI